MYSEGAKRIAWVDHAKAIGIVLVVLGHTWGLSTLTMNLIYSFHMPLFFFLSGFLLKERYLNKNFWEYLARLVRSLVIPYVCFWLISYIYWLLTHALTLDPTKYYGLTFWQLFTGFLYGTGDLDHTLYIINVDLWFFTCLFSTTLLFYIVYRLTAPLRGNQEASPNSVWAVLVLGAVLIALGFASPLLHLVLGFRLPWNIDLAGVAVVFYAAGHFLSPGASLRPFLSSPDVNVSTFNPFERDLTLKAGARPVGLILLVVSALALLVVVSLNGRVDMNTMLFGSLGWFYLGAVLGILMVVTVSQFLPQNRLSRWLSENTIVIFPLHQLLFSIFTGVAVRVLGFPLSFKGSLVTSLVFTLAALICCFPAALLLRRFLPLMIGERGKG